MNTTYTIPAGSTGTTVTVPSNDDTISEGEEQFTIDASLENGSTDTGTGTIVDDDNITILVSNVSVVEGSDLVFDVNLSSPSTEDIDITLVTTETVPVDAAEGADYNVTSVTVTIPAGSTGITVTVPSIEDAIDEQNEDFLLTIASATGGNIVDITDTGTGTIQDNDGAPSVIVGDASVVEGTDLVFEINLTNTSTENINVTLSTSNIDAIAGTDYSATTATVTIPACSLGATVEMTVSSIQDNMDELSETFLVSIDGTTGGAVGDASDTGTGTIVDDDEPDFILSKIQTSVDVIDAVDDVITYSIVLENNGSADLTNINLTENFPGLGASSISPATESLNTNNILEFGETWTYNVNYTVTQADIDTGIDLVNIVSVDTDQLGKKEDNASTPVVQNPSISIVKTSAVAAGVTIGDDVNYTFAVTNTGNVPLTNVNVDDARIGVSNLSVPNLAVGASGVVTAIYILTAQDLIDGNITNQATATGTPPSGPNVTDISDDNSTAEDDPTVTLLASSPSIAIVKTASGTINLIAGDTITYTFTVTNIGDIALINVSVDDERIGVHGLNLPDLAVGGSETVTADYILREEDIREGSISNQAIAKGKTPSGRDVNDTSDDNSQLENEPTISFLTQIPPESYDNNVSSERGKSVLVNVLGDDEKGTFNLDKTTLALVDPDTGENVLVLVVDNEGTWTVDDENGMVTFTPLDGYVGDPTPIEYTVEDENGTPTTSKINIDYPPVAFDDIAGTSLGGIATIPILNNDKHTSSELDPTSISLVPPENAEDIIVDDANDTIGFTVPGEGIWSVDEEGVVTFEPDATLYGNPTPIKYVAKERVSRDVTNEATISITYEKPIAEDDHPRITHYGVNLGTVIANDIAGVGDLEKHTYQLYVANGTFGENIRQASIDTARLVNKNTIIKTEHGQVRLALDGTYSYEPDANYNGPDKFTYVIIDTAGQNEPATVFVDVDCASTQTSDSGDALGIISMFMMMLMTLSTGLYFARREEKLR